MMVYKEGITLDKCSKRNFPVITHSLISVRFPFHVKTAIFLWSVPCTRRPRDEYSGHICLIDYVLLYKWQKNPESYQCTLILHCWSWCSQLCNDVYSTERLCSFPWTTAEGTISYAEQYWHSRERERGRETDTISVLRADLAPTCLMTPDKPESRSSVENLTDTSCTSLGWGEKVALSFLMKP